MSKELLDENMLTDILYSTKYDFNKAYNFVSGKKKLDMNGFPTAAYEYDGPKIPINNVNTYKAAKSVYDSLSDQEKKWLCPNGKFVDSPHLVYRRVLAIYNPKDTNYAIPIGFCEMYSFPDNERELQLIVAVREEYRGDHAALQLLNEAFERVLNDASYDGICIRVNNKNHAMKNFMMSKLHFQSGKITMKKIGDFTEYHLSLITPLQLYSNESASVDVYIEMAKGNQPYKSYPNTYIGQKIASGGESIERPLIKYIMNAERLNKGSEAFRQIQNDIKTRQTSAILYRVLMMPNIVLAMDVKELPASFKVFRAADVRASNKEPKIFIDVTGIIKFNNGIFICNKIDTLITYLTGALVQLLYYDPSKQLTNNASITRPATVCFVKLFTGVIDELRVIGYAENQLKIKYNTAVYFLTSLVGKPMENARSMAANILGINPKEAKAYDYFYSDEAMKDLNSFVTDLCENFHLRGFGTDIMLDRWMFKYGKGTMYGLELYPSFLMMLTNAYCGAYVNQQKTIEKYCGKDMVDISTTLIRVGADVYSEGARYQKDEYGEIVLK